MDEGFKFTFYVKPERRDSENAGPTDRKIRLDSINYTRNRPIFAQISSRIINESYRPLSHKFDRQGGNFRVVLDEDFHKSKSVLHSSKMDSLSQKGNKNLKLFPVIHHFRKVRGVTPNSLLKARLQTLV